MKEASRDERSKQTIIPSNRDEGLQLTTTAGRTCSMADLHGYRRINWCRFPSPASSTPFFSRAPFSGPCASGVSGARRLTWLTVCEACSDTANPCPNYPMRFRPTTGAWEDYVVWAAPHHRKKSGTWELRTL